MDIVTALLGGISGGLAAGWMLRRRPGLPPSQDDPWIPDDHTVRDIERVASNLTDDPVKQRLIGRKALLGLQVTEQRRQSRRRR